MTALTAGQAAASLAPAAIPVATPNSVRQWWTLSTRAIRAVVVNGANLDDRGDYRPGMQAAAEHQDSLRIALVVLMSEGGVRFVRAAGETRRARTVGP